MLVVVLSVVPSSNAWIDVRIPFVKSLVKVAHDTLSWIAPPPEKEERIIKEQQRHHSPARVQKHYQRQAVHPNDNNHRHTARNQIPPVLVPAVKSQETQLPPPKKQEEERLDAVASWTVLWERAIALYGKLSDPMPKQQRQQQMVVLRDLTELIVALGQSRPKRGAAAERGLTSEQISWFQGTLDAMEQQLFAPTYTAVFTIPVKQTSTIQEEDIPSLLHRAAVLIGEAMKRPNVDYKHVQHLINAYNKVKERYNQEQKQQQQQKKQKPKKMPRDELVGHSQQHLSNPTHAASKNVHQPAVEDDSLLFLQMQLTQPEHVTSNNNNYYHQAVTKSIQNKKNVPVSSSKVAQQLEEAILSSILADDENVNPSVEFVVDHPVPKTTTKPSHTEPQHSAPHLTILGDESHSFLSSLNLRKLLQDARMDDGKSNNKVPQRATDSRNKGSDL